MAMQTKFAFCALCVIGNRDGNDRNIYDCGVNPDQPGCVTPKVIPKSGDYRDCMDYSRALYKNSNNRNVYHDYAEVTIAIGPGQRPTNVICDVRKSNPGWTVCIAKCILIYIFCYELLLYSVYFKGCNASFKLVCVSTWGL